MRQSSLRNTLIALACILFVLCGFAAGIYVRGQSHYEKFSSALSSGDTLAAKHAYISGHNATPLVARVFDHKVSNASLSLYKAIKRTDTPSQSLKKRAQMIAPFTVADTRLVTQFNKDTDTYLKNRELATATYRRSVLAAELLAAQESPLKFAAQTGRAYIQGQEAMAKARALEKDPAGASRALALYQSVPMADTQNYGQAQKKVLALKERIARETVVYKGPIRHIFTHCLLAWPQKTIASSAARGYDTDCITVPEFKRVLDQLYKNGYILVHPEDIFSTQGKRVVKKELRLPRGKKPLIFSVDDVTYDPRKSGNGMVDKLIVDEDGSIKTFTAAKNSDTGKDEISADNEVFPILDTFVKEHPDFSHNGAKTTLAMTGFIGCFGYRTDRLAKNQAAEIPRARKVAEALKKAGYTFASHSYTHHHSSQVTYAKVADDARKWKNETENIVGPTKVYIWSYGESVPQNDPKAKLLRDTYGFKMFNGVGAGGYMAFTPQALIMDRAAVDGYSLRNREKEYAKMFDCKTVFDKPIRNRMNLQAGDVR